MSGLDPLGRALVRDIIVEEKQKGTTVFFSSHVLSDVEAICTRVAILVKGKLRNVGPIEDLIGRIRTLRQKGERQIIIQAKEADQLADSLSQVMTRMVTIQEEIIQALKTAKEAQTINIEMDGGGFADKK